MSKGTNSEKQTHDSEKEKSVFSVDMQALQSLQHIQKKPASELVQTNNTAVLVKFCDVCKQLNIDPLHAQALPCVVLLMSKDKHCVEMAHAYAGLVQSADVLAAVDAGQPASSTSSSPADICSAHTHRTRWWASTRAQSKSRGRNGSTTSSFQ
jgi:hypothetical protein